MAFWNESTINILPKFRFKLDFGGVIWWVKTAQFPKLSQEKGEVQTGFGGNVVYKPGPTRWQPITITMADVMLWQSDFPSLTRNMSTQMFWFGVANILDDHQQQQGLLISNTPGKYDEGFGDSFLSGSFTLDRSKISKIEIDKHYDNDGFGFNLSEKWILENILVSEIDFGGGDYSSDDINEISVTLTYDIARLDVSDEFNESTFTVGDTNKEEVEDRIKLNKKPKQAKTIITTLD